MAIEPSINIAIKANSNPRAKLVNGDPDKYNPVEVDLSGGPEGLVIDQTTPHWWNYFLCGVKGAWGHVGASSLKGGFDCLLEGSIPPASGLSSSSAVVVAAALGTLALSGRLGAQEPAAVADLCSVSERFIGTQGG